MTKIAFMKILYFLLIQHRSAVKSQADNEFAEFEVRDEDVGGFNKVVQDERVPHPNINGLNIQNKPTSTSPSGVLNGIEASEKVCEPDQNDAAEFDFFENDFNDDSFETKDKTSFDIDGKDDDAIIDGDSTTKSQQKRGSKITEIKPLTFSDIPSHFRSNWSSYQVETLTLAVILIYLMNYLYGKSLNYNIATVWFSENRQRLEAEFSLVGDDGATPELEQGNNNDIGGVLIRETDCSYMIWSTGRAGCRGMLTTIKLCKRQDLIGLGIGLFRPRFDRVVHRINMDQNELDSFILIFGQRKSVVRAVKEMTDLSTYVSERKISAAEKMPSSFVVFAEIGETVSAIVDSSTVQFIRRFEKYIDYVHISDQYSGPRQDGDQQQQSNGGSSNSSHSNKLPDSYPVIIFSYNLIRDEVRTKRTDEDNNSEIKNERPNQHLQDDVHGALLNFTFFMLERARRYRMSKEGRTKADKKRQSVQENFLKVTHQQRQEAAQNRREERTRERKLRVMEEEDPDKQRRLERIEQKRDARQKQPKMKAFKIK